MTDRKKEAMFAKLVQHHSKASAEEVATPEEAPAVAAPPPPSPAPPDAPAVRRAAAKRPEPTRGKRGDPDYCQANCYVPKTVRKAIDRALIDIDGLDYSTLVTDLLRKWLKSKGIAE